MTALALPGFQTVPKVDATLWGIDPSSVRIALCALEPDEDMRWDVLSLPRGRGHFDQFHAAFVAQAEFFARQAELAPPALVVVEEPFIPKEKTREPTHVFMFGVTLAALGAALGTTPCRLVSPSTWKSRALGKGHGFAKKPEILAWAQSLGYDGQLQDIADAIGVAVGGAILSR